jgi:hypothetical protein
VVVETDDGTLAVVGEGGAIDAAIEKVSQLTDFAVQADRVVSRFVLGAFLGDTGPRAQSFRYAIFDVGNAPQGAMVPVPIVDLPLAGNASAVLAADLDDDGLPNDVIAVLPGAPGLRVQLVTDDLFAGEHLSATSPRLAIGGGPAGRARLTHDDFDGVLGDEVMVLADDGVIVYDDDPPRR